MATNIHDYFQEAFTQHASDVHIAVGSRPLLRINGELNELSSVEIVTAKAAEEMILSLLTKDQQQEFLTKRELDFSYEVPEACRFRVNIHWEREHAGLVARLVSREIPTMEQLALPEVVYDLARRRQGLVLVTGPTGCGKSTTLAAMIDLINTERKAHIVTLEDPIEFVHTPKQSLIRQRQLHSDFLSFPEALKRVVRQDPNVIMVGEMRDLETIAAAITVAETGHLVLATLHTNNAAQTIDRMIDLFPPHQQNQVRAQVSMELLGIVSQQLLPAATGDGRIAAREILVNTTAVANLIRENKTPQIPTVLQTNSANGMSTFDQDIKRLYKEDRITKEIAQTYLSTKLR